MEELYTKMEREQHKFQNIINLLQKKKNFNVRIISKEKYFHRLIEKNRNR